MYIESTSIVEVNFWNQNLLILRDNKKLNKSSNNDKKSYNIIEMKIII